jgi:hypothetical protein
MNRAVDDLSDDDWGDEGNVWEAYRRTCAPGTSVRRLFKSIRGPSHSFQKPIEYLPASIPKYRDDFEFSNSLDHDFRFCNHPWARYQQGHFFSDSRTISTLYPIFSPAKAPGYSDILIPSHEYHVPSKRQVIFGYFDSPFSDRSPQYADIYMDSILSNRQSKTPTNSKFLGKTSATTFFGEVRALTVAVLQRASWGSTNAIG